MLDVISRAVGSEREEYEKTKVRFTCDTLLTISDCISRVVFRLLFSAR